MAPKSSKASAPAKAVLPERTSQPALKAGLRMRCVGLVSCQELNGTFCKLVAYIAESGRWQAECEQDKSLRNFKPSNLEHIVVAAKATKPAKPAPVAKPPQPVATAKSIPVAKALQPVAKPPPAAKVPKENEKKSSEAPEPKQQSASSKLAKALNPLKNRLSSLVGRSTAPAEKATSASPGKRKEAESKTSPSAAKRAKVAPEACSSCGYVFEVAGNFCNSCGAKREQPTLVQPKVAQAVPTQAASSSKDAAKRPKGRPPTSPAKDAKCPGALASPPVAKQMGRVSDAKVAEAKTKVESKPKPNKLVDDKEKLAKPVADPKAKNAKQRTPPMAKNGKQLVDPKAKLLAERASKQEKALVDESVGPAPSTPPRGKRLRGKTSGVENSPNVAMALRRLAALGEADKAGSAEQDEEKTAEAADKIMAAVVAAAEKSSAAELKTIDAKKNAETEELEGEQGSRKRADAPKKTGEKGNDEDILFDSDDDLEGEEDVSDMSDMADQDDEEMSDDEDWEPSGARPYPEVWSENEEAPRPGDQGFNVYAATCLAEVGLGTDKSPYAGSNLRLHQESASFLVHPQSPISRLLVDHATGTGKTFIMIQMMDNFFDDPRPKVAIFPKDRVCDNFYQEMLKWPSRWREFFAFSCPDHASFASGAVNWKRKRSESWDLNNDRLRQEAKRRGVRQEKIVREIIDAMRKALEMKNAIRRGQVRPSWAKKFMKEHPGAAVPHAPLRAFRYTTAGGRASELGEDGWPISPLLKVGYDPKELNPYSGKVVIMDEAHNLVRPTAKFEDQLGKLRTYLYAATRSVLAGFTGTPVGNDAEEGRILLDVVKGEGAAKCSDEGFVSSFHARANADFPAEVPVKGIPDGIIHEGMFEDLVKRHSLHGESLKRYLLKETEFAIVPRLLRLPEETRQARLSNYCNLHVHYGRCFGVQKEALMKDVKQHAPKMHAVVKSIVKHKQKAVVMLAREQGYKTMLEVMQRAGKKSNFRVATLEELHDFNDPRKNLRGERFRVMLAETSQAGEGVSFKHVRRIYLVDVPFRHSDLVQRTSRCVRMGGHSDLPPEERTVAVEMHMAQLPKFLKQGTGSLIYRELLNAKEVHNTPGESLEAATHACLEELQRREVKTLEDLQKQVQGENGEQVIDLLTEIALEAIGDTSKQPARPLAMALWRLRRGGDDLEALEKALVKGATADDALLDMLMDKSTELLAPLEAMRFGAVDRPVLAKLGDPPRAPPPRCESARLRGAKAKKKLKPEVVEGVSSTVEAAKAVTHSVVQEASNEGAVEEVEEIEDDDDELEENEDFGADFLADLGVDDGELAEPNEEEEDVGGD